ncbi:Calx-beta domain-containing protein, partial [Lutibacter sp. B1]|uniref:Calx-beta domain-containing protein n=1 Tax=Lutibacter sp. B1 TaxID=2725996 RepID=UPI001456398E
MKNKLLSAKTKNNIKVIYLILFVFINSIFSFGQQIIDNTLTINKTIIGGEICNQFDVELSITGNASQKPIEVILVIDTSGSMGNSISGDSNTPLYYAKQAAKDFINNIFSSSNNPTGKNKVGIISYNTTANAHTGLQSSGNKTGLINIINGLNAEGWTNISEGIDFAANELNSNGIHNCSTIRSIIVLTDGIANRASSSYNCGSCTSNPTTHTCCTNAAMTSGENSQNYNTGGIDYPTNVYSIALLGAITNSSVKQIARETMQGVQNSGYNETNSAANLTSIYNQIFGQLSWAAKDISVTDIIDDGFNLIPTTIQASDGSYILNNKTITWNIDYVYSEEVTLKYTVEVNSEACGKTASSTTTLNYENSNCSPASENFENPSFCVPCPTIVQNIEQDSCSNIINYSGTVTDNDSCIEVSTYTYLWEFYIDNIKNESLTTTDLQGTVTLPTIMSNQKVEGVFTTTVNSNSGCFSFVKRTEITAYPEPKLEITNPAAVCYPNTVDITSSLITTGSDSGTFTYYTDSNLQNVLANPNVVDTSGTYYILLENTNGCLISKQVTVTINALPIINQVVKVDPTIATCPNLNDGSITINATGENLSYSIDNGLTYQSSNVFDNLSQGEYKIVVKNNVTNCSITHTENITLTNPICSSDVTIVATLPNASEPNTNGQFKLSLTNAILIPTVVTFEVSGTATEGTDYDLTNTTTSITVTIPANTSSITIPVEVIDDDVLEGNETVIVKLLNSDNSIVKVANPDTATVTIADEDTSQLSIVKTTDASEPASDGLFTLSLNNQVSVATVVNFEVSGTATEETDYDLTNTTTSITATIPANTSSITLPVEVIDDDIIEENETVIVTLLSTNNLVTISPINNSSTITITDNEGGAGNGLTISDITVNEGDGTATVQVTLTGNVQGGFSVDYQTADGTAIAEDDYQSQSGTLTFAGTTEESHPITVSIADDTLIEPTE